MPPRVCIVITSYNQERFLPEAIDSALAQTLPPHEIIIADDHSTRDNSRALIRDYVARYPNLIRNILHERNVGIPANRNSGLQIATGEYITVLDGDDRLLPNYLETLTAALAQDRHAGVSYANRYEMNIAGHRGEVRDKSPEPSGEIFAHLAAGRTGRLRALLARLDLVKAAGFFDERFFHHDGFILTLRLAKMTRFVYVAEPLMEKREHGGGTSKTISPSERVKCFEDILGEIDRLGADLPHQERKRIRRRWSRKVATLRISDAIEHGRTFAAFAQLVRAAAQDRQQTRDLWRAFRRSLGENATAPRA